MTPFDPETTPKMTPRPFQRRFGPPNGPVTRLGASLVAILAPRVAPRAPQRHPKGSPRPTKVTLWRQNGRLQWPFRPPKPPQELPKAPHGTHCLPKSQIFTPNHQFSFEINDFYNPSSIVDLPTYNVHPPTWVGGSATHINK